jgi:uncharacterized protein YjbI with pentapeptide repeats
MTKRTHRLAWGLVAVLALLTCLLWPVYPLWRAQWVAKTRGRGANLAGANLLLASLVEAQLQGADLRGAFFTKARCFDADFRGADLRGADLRTAILAGADFRGADLRGADFERAKYDETTRWPEGFDPKKHGAMIPDYDEEMWRALGRPPRSTSARAERRPAGALSSTATARAVGE